MVLLVALFLVGCGASDESVSFEDGTYRGTYSDRNEMNVSVQITLEDNIVTAVRHRHLMYRGVDYLDDDADDTTKGIAQQHKIALEYLLDQDIRDVLHHLYEPGEHIDFGDYDDVDGFTGATIYSHKEISSIMDALNRGVFRFKEVGGEVPEDYSPLD